MSRTYCIACLTCRQQLWIGQGWPLRPDDRYIYSYPEAIKALNDFLFAHGRTGTKPADGREHILAFSDDEWPDVADFDEVELPDSQSGLSREEAIRLGHIRPSQRCTRSLFGQQCQLLEGHNPPCIYRAPIDAAPRFHAENWYKIGAKNRDEAGWRWVAAVRLDSDRDGAGMAALVDGDVVIDGRHYRCRGVERFAHLGPWRKGEGIGLLIEGEPMRAEQHRVSHEPQPIADHWIVRCSCGWNSEVSAWDFPKGMREEAERRGREHLLSAAVQPDGVSESK